MKYTNFRILIILVLFLTIIAASYWVLGQAIRQNIIFEESGISKDEIKIGSSLAKTGLVSYLGIEYEKGAEIYFNKINNGGGIFGRKIKQIVYDDSYIPAHTIANTQKLLVDDKVFALFNYVGSTNAAKVIPMVKDVGVPFVGIFSGANLLRGNGGDFVFNIRPSYGEETEYFVRGAVDQLGLTKVAVFYQNDDFGLDGLIGVKEALKKRGLATVAEASYNRGTLDVESALQTIVDSRAEAVAMIATYSQASKFIKLARERNFSPLFLCLSVVGPEELINNLGNDTKGVVITQILPPPYSSGDQKFQSGTVGILNEYVADLEKYLPGQSPSYGSLEGYLNAKILVEGLKLAGAEPTREKFISGLKSIKNLDIGYGQFLSFNDKSYQGMSQLYLTYISDGKLVEIKDLRSLPQK